MRLFCTLSSCNTLRETKGTGEAKRKLSVVMTFYELVIFIYKCEKWTSQMAQSIFAYKGLSFF